ncbi:hypothetical protein FAM09_01485 [Niastella caeni]|uniref:Uncharacterized protein n=1 Tax=Niastella caeni TaxID=2569763 RepID=A0A4S8I3K9_9BACT|nr:hypothetical protein [Niastella caeni]THU40812.1 hypothetical protein FAM09_01485 [Niastella caeni]
MKKMKLSFVAVALIAICSAFATKASKVNFDYYVSGTSGSNYVVVEFVSNCTTETNSTICKVNSTQEQSGGLVPISTSTAIGWKP